MKKPILGSLLMILMIGSLCAADQAQERIDVHGDPGYAGGNIASPQGNDPVKEAIIKEITAYLEQFKGACFADDSFSIGDPEVFKAKISEKLDEIIVGEQGASEIAKNAPKSLAYHNAAQKGIVWKTDYVQLVFAFDPQTIAQGEAGYTNRQTMMHELTHHIEWLKGRKHLSKIVDPKTNKKIDNPISERNTNYQDRVVNQLWNLIILGDPTKVNPSRKSKTSRESGPSIMGESIRDWQAFETEMALLKKGSSAGKHLPDKDLQALTGFNVELENIQKRYLDGKCGGYLQDMAKLSLMLPKVNPRLEIDEKAGTKPGDPVRVKAVLVNEDMNELPVPEELKPKFIWTKPDAKVSNDNPVDLTPVPERELEVPVKLVITFNEKEYVIAQTTYTLKAGDPISLSIAPPTLAGETNNPYPFTAKADSPPAGARYDWYLDGSRTQSSTSTRYEASFKSEGSHKVSVKLIDSAGEEIQEAKADVTISGGSKSALHIDLSVLENLRPSQTFTLTATVENIPASVSKLKFSWFSPGNACLPSDPPAQRENAWYFQVVTAVNGKATCSITLKENYFQPPGQAYSSPQQRLQIIVQDEPYKKTVFLTADKDYRVKQ